MTPTESEIFELTFERPRNYFLLSGQNQWDIDKKLGILDYTGAVMTEDESKRFEGHYTPKCCNEDGHCLGINLIGGQFIFEADKCSQADFDTCVMFHYCPDCGQPIK